MEGEVSNKDTEKSADTKKVDGKSETKRYSEIFRDFDNLELSIVYSTGDELLVDTDSLSIPESESTDADQNCEGSFCPQTNEVNEVDGNRSAQDADLALCRCRDGVETALQYNKMWCRYAKDLLAWMEKRISLEQEFAKNITKAAEGAKANVTQQEMMPLQYIYTMALEQDIKNSVTSKQTSELLQHRCYQALAAKRNEIDKWRREFKEQWSREQRKMNEAVTALKKARQQYFQRCDELEKAKAVSAKAVDDATGYKTLDKRRKSKDEAQSKVIEAEGLYKHCVNDAKIHQDHLEKVKQSIISHIRKLICQGDTVLKEATVNMFYYQRQQTEPVPLGYHNLELTCRSLEPGEPYLLYILSKPHQEQPLQNFIFQEYIPQEKGNKRKTSNPLSSLQDSSPMTEDGIFRRINDGKRAGCSDSESIGGSLESLSSPAHTNRRLPKASSTGTVSSDDLDDRDMATVLESENIDGQPIKMRTASRAALTHHLRKMKSKMVKCKQCENYIVVNGLECEECGLALHRKCTEVCQLECEHRKRIVFGVDLSPDEVPFVIRHCTVEIERRALSVQGVYRVSGSMPRIQKLCQAFETQKEQVDLSDVSPHDITSIIKHFFKELPEPLLTFDLYNDFVTAGKAIQHLNEIEVTSDTKEVMVIIHKLQELLQKLPPQCYRTLQHMMSHLHRVSENYENKMSPSNLGIVFGPTLLRPLVCADLPVLALLENSYQSLLIEFLITHHIKVFGLGQSLNTPTPPAPSAPDTPPRASFPLDEETYTGPGNEDPSEERLQSLERRSVKRESSEGYISDKSSSNEAVDQLNPEANERAVLAMRGTSVDPQGEPASALATRPHYRFTRQPVKYYRHQNLGTRHSNPDRTARQTTAPVIGRAGSADSSRSSSPEPGTLRPSQPLDTILQEKKVEASLSPREVVQYMLDLDGTSTATGAQSGARHASPREEGAGGRANLNVNQSNNRQSTWQDRATGGPLDRLPVEQNLTSSAEKILSGLKLRRSHSGKDEQLFV